ncbi:MAG: alanine racemase [Bacillota bacterium]|uniref:alanine racemase n=1 Tax=Desulforudis sp. DRI-14 TaxID=3459793 RepID=UPI00347B1F3C
MLNFGPNWVAVRLDNLAHNTMKVRALIGPAVQLLAVVKADGYGHGAVETAKTVLASGADRLGVFDLVEASVLRKAGLNIPILVFCPPGPGQAEEVVHLGADVTLNSLDVAREIGEHAYKAGMLVRIHVKVDTGFHRFGLPAADVPDFLSRLQDVRGLVVEGLYTHFAAHEKSAMSKQLDRFLQLVDRLDNMGLKPPFIHAANSAGTVLLPDSHLGMVRVGNLLYGWGPGYLSLKPAWQVMSTVRMVRRVHRGESVGYGGDFTARRDMTVAVLPLGFADGMTMYPSRPVSGVGDALRKAARAALQGMRSLTAGDARVRFGEHPARLVGRVGMQHCVVDVSNLEVKPGDVASIECRVTAVPPHVPRVYYDRERPVRVRVPGEYKTVELEQVEASQKGPIWL